ncbi:hypothetical protein BDD12DRAFT_208077 [Trichophaea hybrida]|nr:hypothetical protein BDD12DRAFT_208077 [Trichophaea hybrida]
MCVNPSLLDAPVGTGGTRCNIDSSSNDSKFAFVFVFFIIILVSFMPHWNLQLKLRCVSLIGPFLDWNALVLSYLTVVGHSLYSSMKVGGGEGMLSALPQWFVSSRRVGEGEGICLVCFPRILAKLGSVCDVLVFYYAIFLCGWINATRCL